MAPLTVKEYSVPGVSCEHCVRAIKGEVEQLPGVASVDVDIPTKRVTVHFDERAVAPDKIRAAIVEAGYDEIRE